MAWETGTTANSVVWIDGLKKIEVIGVKSATGLSDPASNTVTVSSTVQIADSATGISINTYTRESADSETWTADSTPTCTLTPNNLPTVSNDGAATWAVESGTATYTQKKTAGFTYTDSTPLTSIPYTKATTTTLATITDVTSAATASSFDTSTSGTIKVAIAAIGSGTTAGTVTLSSGDYSLAILDAPTNNGEVTKAFAASSDYKNIELNENTAAKYEVASGNKSITYTPASSTKLATITGAKSGSSAAFSIDGTTETQINVASGAFAGKSIVLTNEEGSSYTLALATDATTTAANAVEAADPAWYKFASAEATTESADGKVVKYQIINKQLYTPAAAENNTQLTYADDGTEVSRTTLATLTNIKDTSEVSIDGNTITVDEAAINDATVTLTNGTNAAGAASTYALALTGVTETPGTKSWTRATDSAPFIYQQATTKNYTLTNNATTITKETVAGTPINLISFSALRPALDLSTFSANAGSAYFTLDETSGSEKITLKLAALKSGSNEADNITYTSDKYELALADDVYELQADKPSWEKKDAVTAANGDVTPAAAVFGIKKATEYKATDLAANATTKSTTIQHLSTPEVDNTKTVTYLTVTGLDLTTAPSDWSTYFTVANESNAYTVTLKKAALEKLTDEDGAISIEGGTNKDSTATTGTLAIDVANVAADEKEWVFSTASGTTTAIYRTAKKSNYYLEDGKIKYSADKVYVSATGKLAQNADGNIITTDGDNKAVITELVKLVNVSSSLTADNVEDYIVLDSTAKTVTMKAGSLVEGGTTFTGSDDYETVALDNAKGGSLSEDVNEWSGSSGSFVYQTVTKSNYSVASNTITYAETAAKVAGTTDTTLATVSGLASSVTADGLNGVNGATPPVVVSDNTITVKKAALTEAAATTVSLTNATGQNYALAIGRDNYSAAAETSPEWKISGTTATYEQKLETNFQLKDGKITYVEEAVSDDVYPTETLMKITGVNSKLSTLSATDLADALKVTKNEHAYSVALSGTAIEGSTLISATAGKEADTAQTATTAAIKLGDDVVTTARDMWSFAGGKATYDTVTPPTYNYEKTNQDGTVASDNTKITVTGGKGNTNTKTNKVTITGLNSALASATADQLGTTYLAGAADTAKEITVSPAALGTAKVTVTGDGYTLKLGEKTIANAEKNTTDTWVVASGSAKYYTEGFDDAAWGYALDTEKKNITYTAPKFVTGAKPAITITGIGTAVTNGKGEIAGITYDSSAGTVELSRSLMGTKNITLNSYIGTTASGVTTYTTDGLKFKFATADTDKYTDMHTTKTGTTTSAASDSSSLIGSGDTEAGASDTTNDFADPTFANGTLTLKQNIRPGYTLSADAKSIFYTAKKAPADGSSEYADTVTLATVKGLKKTAVLGTDYSIDYTTGTVNLLTANALDGKAITATGYKLGTSGISSSLAQTDANALWTVDGNKAVLQKKTSSGYTLSDDGKTLSYASKDSYEVYTTITGINTNVKDAIDKALSTVTFENAKPEDKSEDEDTIADRITAFEGDSGVYENTTSNYSKFVAALKEANPTLSDADFAAKLEEAVEAKVVADLKAEYATAKAAYDAEYAEKFSEKFAADYVVAGTADTTTGYTPLTLNAAALGTANITLKNGTGKYQFALADTGINKTAETTATLKWIISGANASYQKNTHAYYELTPNKDQINDKITYHKSEVEKGSKPEVTIAGINSALTVNADGNITGINKTAAETGADDQRTTLTLTADVLADKTVKISAGDKKEDYKLALDFKTTEGGTTTGTVTKSEVASTWSYATTGGGTLTLTQGQTEGYELDDKATTATYYNGTSGFKAVAKITGLVKSPLDADGKMTTVTVNSNTMDAITVDTENKVITINDKTLVDGATEIKFSGASDYTLALGGDATILLAESDKYWVVNETAKTAIYQQKITKDGFVLDNGKIVKKTVGTNENPTTVDLITIKGLATVSGDKKSTTAADTDKAATEAAVTVNNTTGVVTLKAAALGTAKITSTGSYKLALDESDGNGINQSSTKKTQGWIAKGTTATYEDIYEAYYTLDEKKQNSVTYTAAKKVDNKQTPLMQLSNLKSGFSVDDDIHFGAKQQDGTYDTSKVITLSANAIGTNSKKPTELKINDTTNYSGYTIADNTASLNSGTTREWQFKGTSATYVETKNPTYTYSNGTITYTKGTTAKVVTVSGLAKFSTTTAALNTKDNDGNYTGPITITRTEEGTGDNKTVKYAVTVDDSVLIQKKKKETDNDSTNTADWIYSKNVKVATAKDTEGNKPTATIALKTQPSATAGWYLDGSTAKYVTELAPAGSFKVDEKTNAKISYEKDAKPTSTSTTSISVTGIKKKSDLSGGKISADGTVVTVDSSLLDKKTLTVNSGYTLTLNGETLNTIGTDQKFTTKGTAATLTRDQASGYTISNDERTITYSASAKKNVVLAKVSGIVKDMELDAPTGDNYNEITLTAFQLGESKKLTLDGLGYKFSVDAGFAGSAESGDTKEVRKDIVGSAKIDDITTNGTYLNIKTQAGDDVISATGGNNVIEAGKGDDTITVGAGNNKIVYNNGDGNDTITGIGTTGDTIHLAVFTKADMEKVDNKTRQNTNYVTYKTSGSDTVLSVVKNKKEVGTITLKGVSSLGNIAFTVKDGKNTASYTPVAPSSVTGSSLIGSDNMMSEFYSDNYATGSELSDIMDGGITGFSVGEVETGSITDLTKQSTTPIVTGSDKK